MGILSRKGDDNPLELGGLCYFQDGIDTSIAKKSNLCGPPKSDDHWKAVMDSLRIFAHLYPLFPLQEISGGCK